MSSGEKGGEAPSVRVRGIYATALTHRIREETRIVDPSPPIRERFVADFATGPADAWVETTANRQGVGIHGTVEATRVVVDELRTVASDSLPVGESAPFGAVADAPVIDERGGGGILEVGGRETYLPFEAIDRYVETGDTVRVQVHEARPRWADRRPTVDPTVCVSGRYLSLERGAERTIVQTPTREDQTEFERLTEMIDVTVPEGWGIRWQEPSRAASLDTATAALRRAVEVATSMEDALAKPTEDATLVATPFETQWVWLGRESKFALDQDRDSVTSTIPGHHRIKAATERASTAVDFVERLDTIPEEFPFGPVLEQFGPAIGDDVAIQHGKPDGRQLTLGRGEVVDRDLAERTCTIRRDITSRGTYDGVGTDRVPGDTATTRFTEGRWWFATKYRSAEGEPKGTYVNVCTPVEIMPWAVIYLDLHIDVVKGPEGQVEVLDEAELDASVAAGELPETLATRGTRVAERVASALN